MVLKIATIPINEDNFLTQTKLIHFINNKRFNTTLTTTLEPLSNTTLDHPLEIVSRIASNSAIASPSATVTVCRQMFVPTAKNALVESRIHHLKVKILRKACINVTLPPTVTRFLPPEQLISLIYTSGLLISMTTLDFCTVLTARHSPIM
ncbi:Polynucleotidyl transferase, ribonuclease H superfamily protein [Trifolium repens]|nr:Polynucleotidyl transferase, ribonuclease H superfamily protein [Trifolium repens]KAK2443185.1 Polynucleotidyl transferase, ribonuclease H superfamily protein [Trifolium repens]